MYNNKAPSKGKLPTEKENVKVVQTRRPLTSRIPLAELPKISADNNSNQAKDTRIPVSKLKKPCQCVGKPYESKSTVTIVSTLKTDNETITIKKIHSRSNFAGQTLDRSRSSDAEEFSDISLPANKPVSPIKPNVTSSTNTLIHGNRYANKIVSAGVLQQKHNSMINEIERRKDFYETEYLTENIKDSLRREWRFVLRKDLLKMFNVDRYNRNTILKWLLHVQDSIALPSCVLFQTVYVLDYVLTKIVVPINMYQLVVLTIAWALHKNNTIHYTTENNLLASCSYTYSSKQLRNTEQKILRLLNFSVHTIEPLTFIYYYYYKLGLKNEFLILCSEYILECFIFEEDFTTLPPSMLAAAAVYSVVKNLWPVINWDVLKICPGFYPVRELVILEENMHHQVYFAQERIYQYRQPLKKYFSSEKYHLSSYFRNKNTRNGLWC